jgi:hypothetical protein
VHGFYAILIYQPLTHGAEPFLRSCQLCSHSRTSQHFTEPEGSLPRSQGPSTGPYLQLGPCKGVIRQTIGATEWLEWVTRVNAGSNTSTVTLRVVGGDKKGSLKSETAKYGREYQGTRNWESLRWQGPAAYIKDRPILSSERAPPRKTRR